MLKATEEYANFGTLCSEIVASSTRLKNNDWIPLKKEFVKYEANKIGSKKVEENILFDAYFLSFIELRKLCFLHLLKEGLTNNPSFLERQEIYHEIKKSFDLQLKKKCSVELVEQDEHIMDMLNDLLRKHEYHMAETMDDFFALAQKQYKIKEEHLCKKFFIKETTEFETIIQEAWEYLAESPNEFKTNYMLIQALIIMLFITSIAIFLFIYLPKM